MCWLRAGEDMCAVEKGGKQPLGGCLLPAATLRTALEALEAYLSGWLLAGQLNFGSNDVFSEHLGATSDCSFA